MKKTLIVIGLGIVGLLVIGSTVLLLHIKEMNAKGAAFNHSKSIQLAKITFDQELTPNLKEDINSAITATAGYKNHRYGSEGKSVVFMYDRKQNENNQNFYKQFTSKTQLIDGNLYKADADLMAKGCPVMDENSVSYRISSGFEKLAAKLF